MMHRVAIVFLLVIAATSSAHADRGRAKELFEEGLAFVEKGKLAKACASFNQSLELDDTVETKLELADCLDKQGYAWRAWQLFVAARADADSDDQKQRAKERAGEIEDKLAVVIIKVEDPETPGLGITINGREVTPAKKIRQLVDPGSVEVVAVASESRFNKTVEAEQGAKVTVTVPRLAQIEKRRKRGWVYGAVGFGILGGAGIIGGAGVLILPDTWIGATADEYAPVYLGIGLGAGAVAAAMFYFAPQERVKHVLVVPTATDEGAGLVLTGTF